MQNKNARKEQIYIMYAYIYTPKQRIFRMWLCIWPRPRKGNFATVVAKSFFCSTIQRFMRLSMWWLLFWFELLLFAFAMQFIIYSPSSQFKNMPKKTLNLREQVNTGRTLGRWTEGCWCELHCLCDWFGSALH